MSLDNSLQMLQRVLKRAGLEQVRFHGLKHAFSMLALQNGVDVNPLSGMLGHYDAGFALRIYTYATRQMQNPVAETMGNFMPRAI